MQTAEIGKELVALCNEGRYLEAIDKLYAEEVVSSEAFAAEGRQLRVVGKAAVRAKNAAWLERHELNIVRIEGPFVARDRDLFAVYFYVDSTERQTGQRRQAAEIGLYRVAGGSIVKEQFLADGGRSTVSSHQLLF